MATHNTKPVFINKKGIEAITRLRETVGGLDPYTLNGFAVRILIGLTLTKEDKQKIHVIVTGQTDVWGEVVLHTFYADTAEEVENTVESFMSLSRALIE